MSLSKSSSPEILIRECGEGREDVLPQLANLMLSRVAEQAFSLAGRGVLLLDLLQEGGLALWQAILSYEDGDFESHCNRYIQRSLNKALILQAREFGVGQKMRQAMEHLENGVPASQVAELLDFSEINYFYTVFKRETGMTPTQYRKSRLDN